ncbi:unnamed protein product [Kluyveromyces dobzhanskii CBS 2104]|uniref:WGS project CCBQ000000000 data, contig MAT n=1 Tax=Kluyveromyces dobzhanskii CBS 2104 TaxID=1427455 RepID=A0A0A8L3H4_9SACH|nr:unnamed protein product [Kluyveromyces dobzhanskii CBS 2104]
MADGIINSDSTNRVPGSGNKRNPSVQEYSLSLKDYEDNLDESNDDGINSNDASSDDGKGLEDFMGRKQGSGSPYRENSSSISDDGEENDVHYKEDDEGDDIPIEAFNVDEELKSGAIDRNGNATGKIINDSEDEDQWITDFTSKESIKRAREAHQNVVTEQGKNKKRTLYRLEEALEQLYYFIPRGTTIQQALVSLQQLRKNMQIEDRQHTKYVANAIQTIITLVTVLEQKGIENAMQLKKENVKELYEEENLMGSVINDVEAKDWHFKWFKNMATIHSSFSNYEMQSWKENYFNSDVVVKRLPDTDGSDLWYHIDCIFFM